ncbi:MAG: hypothetical protein ACI3YK_05865 [Eubacteriales bacterium]
MKKVLKNNIVGLVILMIWAIISVNSWPIAPVFLFEMMLHDVTGSAIIPEFISLYLPTFFVIIIMITLAERTIQETKYWMYGIPLQIAICVIIAIIDPRSWTFKILYTLMAFLIQTIGVFLHQYKKNQQRPSAEEQVEENLARRKQKGIPTGALWGFLALVVIGWPLICGVCLIVYSIS